MPLTPPRKNPPVENFTRTEKTPLETLIFLGIPKTRAEKALAATGGCCSKKALEWLVSHVNDVKLDESQLREYIIYAVPVGAFGEQLLNFWFDSRDLCMWNDAHNRFPHVTLVSFFKASAVVEQQISKALKTVIDKLNAYLEKRIELTLHQDEKFIGFHINSPDKQFFEKIAHGLVDAIKAIQVSVHNEPSPLLACCSWAPCNTPSSPVRIFPVRAKGSLDGVPAHEQLHLTLAYNYDKNDSITLSSMVDRFEYIDASEWEIKLFSRDIRPAQSQVFRVIRKYRAQAHDELDMNIGDYITATEVSVINGDDDGWVFGSNLATGANGYYLTNHVIRVPESDSWSLHTRIQFVGSGLGSFKSKEPFVEMQIRRPETSLEDCARVAIDSEKKTIPWKSTIGKLLEKPSDTQKLLIMRHAERVDYTFPKWTEQCFSDSNGYERLDLNMPLYLPNRKDDIYLYPWKFDTPVTNIGLNQAHFTGKMLKDQGVSVGFVYCSPAFRCVQTAQAVLQGLESPIDVKIRIEPSLFEWCANYTEVPTFLTIEELRSAGYNCDPDYVPLMSYENLKYRQRSENLNDFYIRNSRVSEQAVKYSTENSLIVAHAANLETNSRLLLDGIPMCLRALRELMEKIPYACLLALEKNENLDKWIVTRPIILPLTHSRNFQFDSRMFAELHRSSILPR